MRAKLVLTTLLSFSFYLLSSQVPQGFNYQAVALDQTNHEITNTALQVKISILSDTTGFRLTGSGTYIWEEQQNVTTDKFGSFSLMVGNPSATRIQGVSSFSVINWKINPLYIGTKVFWNSTWKPMGSARLLSVPYSMISGDFSGSMKKLLVSTNETSLDSALFEVRNKDGQTVFAVYNEGVRIYVDDGEAGKATKKGGFAIGSFNKYKGVSVPLFVVDPDSIRAYIDTGLVKTRKGGFAIGSFSRTKAVWEEYFHVSRDSTRIYIDNSGTKAAKGGFAVGGFSTYKAISPKFLSVNYNQASIQVKDSSTGFALANITNGVSQNFLRINTINYRIGHQSGEKLNQTMAKYNTFIGYQTGYNTTDGRENLFVGYLAGYNNLTASYNVYMGTESGKSNINGTSNVFIGYGSGKASTTSSNTYIGMKAGYANAPGAGNTYIGYCSGVDDGRPGYSGGSFNTFLGFNSGAKNYTGSNNVYIGAEASGNSRGSGRIFIGYQAGYSVFGDSLLVIENHSSSSPLVYGDFPNNIFRINGSIQYTGTIGQVSDRSLKKDILPLNGTLEKLLRLNPSSFYWKEGIIKDLEMDNTRQIGLIAQDVETEFPELLGHDYNKYKTVDYSKLSVLILPALRELNDKIVSKDREIVVLNNEISTLKKEIEEVQKKLETISSGKN